MSWQLLVVVVAPIVGGQLLDSRYHTAHVWIIVGMAVGLAGTVIVVRQAMRQLSEIMGQKSQESKK
jgi:F0F1-type ATP synthase assembly protein I